MKKTTKIFRTICLVIVSLSFLAGGVSKLTGSASQVSMFAALHLQSTLIIIGILEIIIAIGVWCKKTRTVMILLATAVLGAAVAETISLGMASEIFAPGIIMLLAWAVLLIDRCACHCDCEACKDCIANKK